MDKIKCELFQNSLGNIILEYSRVPNKRGGGRLVNFLEIVEFSENFH